MTQSAGFYVKAADEEARELHARLAAALVNAGIGEEAARVLVAAADAGMIEP